LSKKLFRPELDDRVSHKQYQKTMNARARVDRILGVALLLSGGVALGSSLLAAVMTPLGSYTGAASTDVIVLLFIAVSGFYFLSKGLYFIQVFQCRFCLARIPQGSTYCPTCKADLLSNDNPQDA
jgi:hypothetical protein